MTTKSETKSDHKDHYDAVVTAIREATEGASRLGWQGYELQAHIFCAAFAAASGKKPVTEPESEK